MSTERVYVLTRARRFGDVPAATAPVATAAVAVRGSMIEAEVVPPSVRSGSAWTALVRHAIFARFLDGQERLKNARAETTRRFPPAMSVERKRQGCTEVVWDVETPLAGATADALDVALINYARYERGDGLYEAMLRTAWKSYVRARLRVWQRGSARWMYETPEQLYAERKKGEANDAGAADR